MDVEGWRKHGNSLPRNAHDPLHLTSAGPDSGRRTCLSASNKLCRGDGAASRRTSQMGRAVRTGCARNFTGHRAAGSDEGRGGKR
jgi:hypothetical protein